MSYEPQGVVKPFIDAVRAEPSRVWTSREIARVLDVHESKISAWMTYPMKAGAVHRGRRAGETVYSGQPFPPEAAFPVPAVRNKELEATPAPALASVDVPRFIPPKMTAPRPGSEHPRLLTSTPRPAPLGAPQPAGVGVATTEPPPPAAPVPAAQELAPAPTPAPAEPEASISEEVLAEVEEEEQVEPDAFVSCRTGEIVLVGIDPDEEGRITIPADLVLLIKRQIEWSPAR